MSDRERVNPMVKGVGNGIWETSRDVVHRIQEDCPGSFDPTEPKPCQRQEAVASYECFGADSTIATPLHRGGQLRSESVQAIGGPAAAGLCQCAIAVAPIERVSATI